MDRMSVDWAAVSATMDVIYPERVSADFRRDGHGGYWVRHAELLPRVMLGEQDITWPCSAACCDAAYAIHESICDVGMAERCPWCVAMETD